MKKKIVQVSARVTAASGMTAHVLPLKMILPANANDPDDVRRFDREVEVHRAGVLRERKDTVNKAFDAAVAAEAKRLDIDPAVSAEFVAAVSLGLKAQKFKAGREKIYSSVRRIRQMPRKSHRPKKS
jgi:hypothetical protein